MNRFYTTVEESKHLLELGLSAETADMLFVEEYNEDSEGKLFPIPVVGGWKSDPMMPEPITLPCWSLSALLELMPKYELWKSEDGSYDCIYNWYQTTDKTAIVAVYNMVIELLKNNIIKKG